MGALSLGFSRRLVWLGIVDCKPSRKVSVSLAVTVLCICHCDRDCVVRCVGAGLRRRSSVGV